MACQAVANIVKSSLGPVGLDKVPSLIFFFQFLNFITIYEFEIVNLKIVLFVRAFCKCKEISCFWNPEIRDVSFFLFNSYI